MHEVSRDSRRGTKVGIALLILVVLLYSCHGGPPVRMPWQSTDTYKVKTVNSDYEVSRFWACGWAGGCPLKEWRRCLEITPKEPFSALQWYARTSKAHEEIVKELTRRVEQNDRAAIADIMAKTQDGLLFTASYQMMGDNKPPASWSIYPGCTRR